MQDGSRWYLERVTVGEGLAAAFALEWLLGRVQLLDVDAQVRLAATGGGTQLALEDRLVTRVDQLVSLSTESMSS